MPDITVVRLSGDDILSVSLRTDERLNDLFAKVAETANGPCKLVFAGCEILPGNTPEECGLVDGSILTAVKVELPPIFSLGLAFAAISANCRVFSWLNSSTGEFFKECREKELLQQKLLREAGTLPVADLRRLHDLLRKIPNDVPTLSSPVDLKDELEKNVERWCATIVPLWDDGKLEPSTLVAIAALKTDLSVVFWRMPLDHDSPQSARNDLAGGVHLYSSLEEFALFTDTIAVADVVPVADVIPRRRNRSRRWQPWVIIVLPSVFILVRSILQSRGSGLSMKSPHAPLAWRSSAIHMTRGEVIDRLVFVDYSRELQPRSRTKTTLWKN